MPDPISIFWFRRDLRLEDNVGLYHSLKGDYPILPIFIFDSEILEKLPRNDARVSFIYEQLQRLRKQLSSEFNSNIALFHGSPLSIFEKLAKDYSLKTVYTNHDYEPYAIQRDSSIKNFLIEKGISFKTFKDQVIFEKDDIVKADGSPYVVYTPYMKRWKEKFNPSINLLDYDASESFGNLYQNKSLPNLKLEDLGFETSTIKIPEYKVTSSLIQSYGDTRDYPAIEYGTSRLGPHLRFGTVSVRKMIKKAVAEQNKVFWNELIWREFFMQILWHYPHTVHTAFKPKYDRIAWRNNKEEFERWKKGTTGYALVDAGMRELNSTGYMHNRVRMLVASFLCKHLLIDWRWGEAYFAQKLLDYELASNVGNWQWAAGSGVDAAPYFRIFNPLTQVDKFDKQHEYISKWVPELQELSYPTKMVDHKFARERCLKVYREAVG
ncbi:cryptochrome/photolyase family protein [Flagellimonas nanhaiensis]|uniref:Deoxyribodipyrimidine photo-lyase n=1 Tax=Flagellimonas nanhaiensis TaxID=2292706 RepID=A0A371JVD6_9FLAO|nr:deoxyribodipyrimidine photo-lyase [Allomuricauda nanhaiensis]RDY61779.1 deoxyribodipyrimidine photo-lyase [Allomuricauda nanhaiensis]